ncbi:hypothetical protein AXF42_Ash015547 [Apostasia shenzhenica]|uniref:Saposin B-type domain-containing protein n=1 Tax=Apostasia shenzhenica TaxID=1088818 RepID=A0A2I0AKH5_9ASPA|nr:hypothetical protein AXF42_Ash015547 [Apostasia shenzhenica]
MKMRMASSIVLTLLTWIVVDARYSIEPLFMEDSACNSCLEASRKAERTLRDQNALQELDVLSSEVCSILPASFESQCLEKSKMRIHHTKVSFQELFHEKNLCNSTGLCIDQPLSQEVEEILVENKMLLELEDDRGCMACRRAVKELLTKMKQPKMKTKIIEALIDYCEESEDNEEQCKKTVYKYGPTVLTKLEKLKPADLCFMMGMCDESITLVKLG